MQAYSDPAREHDPHALPDLDIWHEDGTRLSDDEPEAYEAGWYWCACFPGCMPDSDPCGPFTTYTEALADARQGMED